MKRSYTFKCVSNLAPYSRVKHKQSFQRTAALKNLCRASQLRLNGRTPYNEMPRDWGNVFVIRKVRFIGALFSIHFAITGFKLLFVTM